MPGMNPDETETLPIVIAPAKVLKTRARLVTAADNDAVRTLLGRMFATMYRAHGIGLAAPPIHLKGYGLRNYSHNSGAFAVSSTPISN